ALAVPRKSVSLQFPTPIGVLTGTEAVYNPILDLLSDRIATMAEISALPSNTNDASALQAMLSLVSSGQVFPIVGKVDNDTKSARRFNTMIVEEFKLGRLYSVLAAPVARTGLPVSPNELCVLAAHFEGQGQNPSVAAQHTRGLLSKTGQHVMKDGKPIET